MKDGTMLVTLSDGLVAINQNREIQTLIEKAPWGQLYPDSSVLADHEQKLYVGMRQYVAEFDLMTKKLRFLVPSLQFVNKLSREEEEKFLM